jgi:hypothetical protein
MVGERIFTSPKTCRRCFLNRGRYIRGKLLNLEGEQTLNFFGMFPDENKILRRNNFLHLPMNYNIISKKNLKSK